VRRVASILTALSVLLSSAYCACATAAAGPAAAAAHAHACCDHGAKPPAKPGHSHDDPARGCPHCDGSGVTAAPQKSQDAQHVTALLPAFTFDAVFDPVGTSSAEDLGLAPPLVSVATRPAPTLLGLHCALTL
jgi:hypothetical protein